MSRRTPQTRPRDPIAWSISKTLGLSHSNENASNVDTTRTFTEPDTNLALEHALELLEENQEQSDMVIMIKRINVGPTASLSAGERFRPVGEYAAGYSRRTWRVRARALRSGYSDVERSWVSHGSARFLVKNFLFGSSSIKTRLLDQCIALEFMRSEKVRWEAQHTIQ